MVNHKKKKVEEAEEEEIWKHQWIINTLFQAYSISYFFAPPPLAPNFSIFLN